MRGNFVWKARGREGPSSWMVTRDRMNSWNTESNIIKPEIYSDQIVVARWEARREINLRIVIQNMILVVHVITIAGLMLLAGTGLVEVWTAWFVSLFTSFSLGQIWLHSGIRHAQFRMFFMRNLDRHATDDFVPWETFLKMARPRALLGAHWYISTKAVLGTSHLSVIAAAGIAMGFPFFFFPGFIVLCVTGGGSSLVLLYLLKHPPLPDFDPGLAGNEIR